MQSSYSVIKSNDLLSGQSVQVNTDYEYRRKSMDDEINVENSINESFRNIGEKIIQNAHSDREKIITEAYESAAKIEKETYEKAYEQGLANGREDGYKEAYEENIEKALEEAGKIREEAVKVLQGAKLEYEKYLEEKTEDILSLCKEISEHIIGETLRKDIGLNKFVESILRDSRSNKSFIIRVNEIHKETLTTELNRWKLEFSLRGEVFILEDNSLESGNAIIEMESGKVEVGIEKALESIKSEIF